MTTTQAAKHTPGPWTLDDQGSLSPNGDAQISYFIEGNAATFVGALDLGEFSKDHPHIERARANARLISQAPAIAEALKTIAGLGGVASEIARNALEAINDVL